MKVASCTDNTSHDRDGVLHTFGESARHGGHCCVVCCSVQLPVVTSDVACGRDDVLQTFGESARHSGRCYVTGCISYSVLKIKVLVVALVSLCLREIVSLAP